MRIEEVELFESSPFTPAEFTVITNYPQTNASWLVNNLAARQNGQILTLSPTNPLPVVNDAESELVIVVGTEMPILSGLVDADRMLQALAQLRLSFKYVIVDITISEALLASIYETGRQLGRFVKLALYEAQLVLQLQPLATGRARDITGRLVIAAGPKMKRKVLERSLFYYVSRKNSAVDLRVA